MVGIGTTTPDTSAALDITSTTKGFLIPRMTTSQRTAIATPANGLQVYDTDTKSQWYYNGTVWVQGASKADGSKWTNDATNTKVALTNLSDGITARTAGSEFVIKDDGKVGIGTSSPAYNLSIQNLSVTPINGVGVILAHGDDASTVDTNHFQFQTNYTGGGSKRGIYMGTGIHGNGNYNEIIGIGTDNLIGLQYNSNATAALNNYTGLISGVTGINSYVGNFSSTGYVNRGTGASLSVEGVRIAAGLLIPGVKANKPSDVTGHEAYGIRIYANSIIASGGTYNAQWALFIEDTSNNYFAGNIGIGTTNPTSKLDINGYLKLASTDSTADLALVSGLIRYNSGLQFYNGSAWNTVATGISFIGDTTNSLVKLSTLSNGTSSRATGTDFVIKDDGKVGIGTISPTNSLEIFGVNNTLKVAQDPTTPGNSAIWLTYAGSNNTVDVNLHGTHIYKNSFNSNLSIGPDLVQANAKLTLTSSGLLGIGVTTPTEKLEVNGAIKIGTTTTATPTAGTIRFNSTTSKFEGYDGTAWVAFH